MSRSFLALKNERGKTLSGQEPALSMAKGSDVRYLGVQGSFQLHSVLGAVLWKCLPRRVRFNYISNVHEVVSSSLKRMEKPTNTPLLKETLKKMAIFKENTNFSEVCVAMSHWISKLRQEGIPNDSSEPQDPKLFFGEVSEQDDVIAMLKKGISCCYLIWLKSQDVSGLYGSKEERSGLLGMINTRITEVAEIKTVLNPEQIKVVRVWSDIMRGLTGFVMDCSSWDAVREWLQLQKERFSETSPVIITEVMREEYELGTCFRDNVLSFLSNDPPSALKEPVEETIVRDYRLHLGMANGYCRINN